MEQGAEKGRAEIFQLCPTIGAAALGIDGHPHHFAAPEGTVETGLSGKQGPDIGRRLLYEIIFLVIVHFPEVRVLVQEENDGRIPAELDAETMDGVDYPLVPLRMEEGKVDHILQRGQETGLVHPRPFLR